MTASLVRKRRIKSRLVGLREDDGLRNLAGGERDNSEAAHAPAQLAVAITSQTFPSLRSPGIRV